MGTTFQRPPTHPEPAQDPPKCHECAVKHSSSYSGVKEASTKTCANLDSGTSSRCGAGELPRPAQGVEEGGRRTEQRWGGGKTTTQELTLCFWTPGMAILRQMQHAQPFLLTPEHCYDRHVAQRHQLSVLRLSVRFCSDTMLTLLPETWAFKECNLKEDLSLGFVQYCDVQPRNETGLGCARSCFQAPAPSCSRQRSIDGTIK